jgi:mannitol/fructose-specific phosphotransferase system IIA component (Ntr-type)
MAAPTSTLGPAAPLAGASPLLVLAVLLVAGGAGGMAAKRAGLPRVTGQILAGIVLGPSMLGLFDGHALHALLPITAFALALMTMSVGNHLDLRRLKGAGQRLGMLVMAEALLVPLLVTGALVGILDLGVIEAALFGTLAISTAPATIVALVKETRARGVFVKTLLAGVALNNIACIVLFETAHQAARVVLDTEHAHSWFEAAYVPVSQMLVALFVGGLIGYALVRSTRVRHRPADLAGATLVALLAAAGVAEYAGSSPLLAALFLGVTLVNLPGHREGLGEHVFADFEPSILCIFFTMAGLELDFSYARVAGGIAVVFVLARILAKVVAGRIAMQAAEAPPALGQYLGIALTPQAGVAIGLLLLVQRDPAMASVAQLLLAAGVTSVAVNEVIGPVLTRLGLQRSGEADQDRSRLIEFLREETILTDFQANSKEEAIEAMVARMVQTCRVPVDQQALLEAVLDREAEASTCLGRGMAVPHAPLEHGHEILGVMALSREGLSFETPDGDPVHCMVLLATPPHLRDRHVAILAALARLAQDDEVREDLFHSHSPAHAYVLLQAEEFEEFNEFLEEMDNF